MPKKKLSLEEAVDFLFELPDDLSEVSDLEYEDANLESETTSFSPRTGSSDEAPSIHAVLNRVSHQIQSLKHLLMII